jgi:hypothetical protein
VIDQAAEPALAQSADGLDHCNRQRTFRMSQCPKTGFAPQGSTWFPPSQRTQGDLKSKHGSSRFRLRPARRTSTAIFRDRNAPSIAAQPGFDHGHLVVDRTTGSNHAASRTYGTSGRGDQRYLTAYGDHFRRGYRDRSRSADDYAITPGPPANLCHYVAVVLGVYNNPVIIERLRICGRLRGPFLGKSKKGGVGVVKAS